MANQHQCPKCAGTGSYMYDHNHSKPCELCCDHGEGWWQLTEGYGGYREGADNGCCRKGCGQLRRDLEAGDE